MTGELTAGLSVEDMEMWAAEFEGPLHEVSQFERHRMQKCTLPDPLCIRGCAVIIK